MAYYVVKNSKAVALDKLKYSTKRETGETGEVLVPVPVRVPSTEYHCYYPRIKYVRVHT